MKKTKIIKLEEYNKPESTSSDVIDVEIKEIDGKHVAVNKSNDIEMIKIDRCTPISIHKTEETDKDIATMMFLCHKASDKKDGNDLFIIRSYYLFNDKEDIEYVASNPLYDDNNFTSSATIPYVLSGSLDTYETDLNITFKDDTFSLMASLSEGDKIIKIELPAHVAATIGAFDDYLTNGNENLHDYVMSCTIGSQVENSTYTIASDINKVIHLALADKKTNTVGCIFEVKNAKDELHKILIPLYLDKKYPNKKFDMTIEDLGGMYSNDKDQYVTRFSYETRLDGIGKDFFVILGYNNENEDKVFLIDTDNVAKLMKLIDEF